MNLEEEIQEKIRCAYISLEGMTPTQVANVDNGLAKLQRDVKALLDPYVILKRVEGDLRERLADFEHRQWSHWTRHFLEFQNPENLEWWNELAHQPYSKLLEKVKASDREWADKTLAVIQQSHLVLPLKKVETLKQKIKAIFKEHYFSKALEITLKVVDQDVLKVIDEELLGKVTKK